MSKIKDLTQGNIVGHLFRLALPIMGTMLNQMVYNLTDMLWLGRLGSNAVAAVGAAGFFIWFGMALLMTTRVGAEIGVSQSVGEKNMDKAARFARHAVLLGSLFSVIYSFITIFNASDLIGFFKFDEPSVVVHGSSYLRIVSLAFVFTYVNPTFSAIYNGIGNSRLPFWYLLVGLIVNVVLDPIFIFGIGSFQGWGVDGAAWATVVAQFSVWIIFVYRFFIYKEVAEFRISGFRFSREITTRIIKLGSPVAVESSLFAIFAMVVTRLVSQFGHLPVAIQSVGAQIEAVSWMTANGFASALGSFVGQNYGAGNWDRIRKGYWVTIGIGVTFGLMVTLAFLSFGSEIFSLFFYESQGRQLGQVYLSILAVSQVFMILEITSRGAFSGIGKPMPPSIIGIAFTGARVPAAYLINRILESRVTNIWWVVSISSIFKGTILSLWFFKVLKKNAK